jgi:RimJ/RimL family protein N-acetyltransferase
VALDVQPTLLGPVVQLRPLRESDYESLFAVASDPLLWEQHPARNRCQEPVFREFFAQGMASGGALLVADATTQAVLGSSRYAGYLPESSEVEIGWTFLARSCWGGAVNTALKALMLEHAFGSVESVIFTVGELNLRSQRAVLKLGAVLAGPMFAAGTPHLRFRLARATYSARTMRMQVSGDAQPLAQADSNAGPHKDTSHHVHR